MRGWIVEYEAANNDATPGEMIDFDDRLQLLTSRIEAGARKARAVEARRVRRRQCDNIIFVFFGGGEGKLSR
jgi:hypothetical protein